MRIPRPHVQVQGQDHAHSTSASSRPRLHVQVQDHAHSTSVSSRPRLHVFFTYESLFLMESTFKTYNEMIRQLRDIQADSQETRRQVSRLFIYTIRQAHRFIVNSLFFYLRLTAPTRFELKPKMWLETIISSLCWRSNLAGAIGSKTS